MRCLFIFSLIVCICFTVAGNLNGQISVPERNVQIRTVNLEQQWIEIHNFGAQDRPLDGWRFCTHDEDEVRRYSSPAAFNGTILPAGESMFLMYGNNAFAANEFNVADLGNFATPLDASGAYGIQFYFRTPFGVGANIADHLQFSFSGVGDAEAAERSDEAEDGNVWEGQDDWISVSSSTTLIELLAGAEVDELHNSADYRVFNSDVVTSQIIGGVLFVDGTQGPDTIVVSEVGGDLIVDVAVAGRVFDADIIASVIVNGFGGADELILSAVTVPTIINGGFGADLVMGSVSVPNDIFGGPGADTIFGGQLDDMINSGRGQDFANAGAGNDFLIGGDASDQLFGGDGDDELLGGLGADELSGGNGADTLVGNTGADRLFGGGGADELSGLGGPDELFGGAGDDQLRGGEGFDILSGGGGSDTALDVGEVETSIEQ